MIRITKNASYILRGLAIPAFFASTFSALRQQRPTRFEDLRVINPKNLE